MGDDLGKRLQAAYDNLIVTTSDATDAAKRKDRPVDHHGQVIETSCPKTAKAMEDFVLACDAVASHFTRVANGTAEQARLNSFDSNLIEQHPDAKAGDRYHETLKNLADVSEYHRSIVGALTNPATASSER